MPLGIVVDQNADLPLGGPRRKFKGRVACQGNHVKSQKWGNAVFADLGSSPPSMEAGRLVGTLGLRPDDDIQQSDAVHAYLQAQTKGRPTWVVLTPRSMASILADDEEASLSAQCCPARPSWLGERSGRTIAMNP